MTKKAIILAVILIGAALALGFVQQTGSETYQMSTVSVGGAAYVVVMDSRTSLVRVAPVTESHNQRFFGEDERRIRYTDKKAWQ